MLIAGPAELTAHGVHSALVAGGLVVLVLLLRPAPSATAVARLRRAARDGDLVEVATRRASAQPSPPALRVAAIGSVAAAWIHALVAGEHLAASVVTGSFFVLAAVAQTAWAAALLTRPSYAVVVAGCAFQLALVAVWAVSRTVLGEPVGLVDALAVTYELAAVVGGAAVARRWTPALPADGRRSGVALAIGGVLVLGVVGL